MKTGAKLNVTKTIRSSKTGILLPRKGTLVSVTENLGRTLLLVEFEEGRHDYVFEYEVEFDKGNASGQEYAADAGAQIWECPVEGLIRKVMIVEKKQVTDQELRDCPPSRKVIDDTHWQRREGDRGDDIQGH
jgi:hypothetical protein